MMETEITEEYKTTDAQAFIEVYAHCPYCNNYQDVFMKVRDVLNCDEPRATNTNVEIACEECEKIFIITEVNY